nr:immunoglobulin heavy chain junction region [Macaca mulatta]
CARWGYTSGWDYGLDSW